MGMTDLPRAAAFVAGVFETVVFETVGLEPDLDVGPTGPAALPGTLDTRSPLANPVAELRAIVSCEVHVPIKSSAGSGRSAERRAFRDAIGRAFLADVSVKPFETHSSPAMETQRPM
jgi:hypothetical protein